MKSKFSSTAFEIIVVGIVTVYLLYNIGVFSATKSIVSLLPISIQMVLFVFLLTKNKYLPLALKIWAVVFIVGGVAGVISFALHDATNDEEPNHILLTLINLVLGIIMFMIASREIEIIEVKSLPDC